MTAAFLTEFDQGCASPDSDEAPGLIFNPAATVNALLPLAISRVFRLHKHLLLWACADAGDLRDAASALEPLAREIQLILDQLDEVAHRVEE
jgi:hypothetical protein